MQETPESRSLEARDQGHVAGRRQRLGDRLYGQILELMIAGRLRQGDRLPTEKAICDMFAVSRPIVREALMRLRADGLIQSRQGAGTFVINQPVARLTSFASTEDIAGYLRCIEVRLPLEGAAARLAAERRSPAQLDRLRATHETFCAGIEAGSASEETDLAFHAAVAEATGNAFFVATLRDLNEAVSGFMRLSLNLTRTGSAERARQVVEEHTRIAEAIARQDVEAAGFAMQFHISQARRRLVDRSREM